MQLRNRHGSFWKRTYTATDLRPYRKAAESYISTYMDEPAIEAALKTLRNTLDSAGPVERMSDQLKLPAHRKARAVLARIRRAEIPTERLLAIHFAISAAVIEDPIRPGGEPHEYRLVQIAKATLKQASGYHSHYGPGIKSYHRYPRSSGLLLRHLGRILEEACEIAADRHLRAVLDHKLQQYGARETKSVGNGLRG